VETEIYSFCHNIEMWCYMFDVIIMARIQRGGVLPLLFFRINRGFVVSRFGEMKPVVDRSGLKHAHSSCRHHWIFAAFSAKYSASMLGSPVRYV
jgi:hypothetical protein